MSTRALPVLGAIGIVTVGRLSKFEKGEHFPDLVNDDFDVLDLGVVDELLFLERPEVEGVLLERPEVEGGVLLERPEVERGELLERPEVERGVLLERLEVERGGESEVEEGVLLDN